MPGGSNDLSSALHKARKRSNPYATSYLAHHSHPFPDRQRKGQTSGGAAALRTTNAVDKGVLHKDDFFKDDARMLGGGVSGSRASLSGRSTDGDDETRGERTLQAAGNGRSQSKNKHAVKSNQPLITDALGPLRTLPDQSESMSKAAIVSYQTDFASNIRVEMPKHAHINQRLTVNATPKSFQLSIDINDILDDPNLLGLQSYKSSRKEDYQAASEEETRQSSEEPAGSERKGAGPNSEAEEDNANPEEYDLTPETDGSQAVNEQETSQTADINSGDPSGVVREARDQSEPPSMDDEMVVQSGTAEDDIEETHGEAAENRSRRSDDGDVGLAQEPESKSDSDYIAQVLFKWAADICRNL